MDDPGGVLVPNKSQENIPQAGKRRRSDPKQWKGAKVKRKRDSGEAHVSLVGKEVPARQQTILDCRCECIRKFSPEERATILDRFNQLADHEKQNIYLRGCVSAKDEDDMRRRPRNENSPAERRSFVYTLTVSTAVSTKTRTVCKKIFCGLHGIKESRLKRKVLKLEVDIQDGRGHHNNHAKLDDAVRDRIRQHIGSFPARESHYSRSKQTTRKYLDASLSISEMYRLFLRDNPDLDGNVVKRWVYADIFNHEFNIAFGYPRSDICDTCERFNAQIRAASSQFDDAKAAQLKAQHELHVRKADVFNTQMKTVSSEAKEDEERRQAVLCMDFQKNLPLPLTGIGQEYYKRQLWVHNFGIHDMIEGNATMYLYSEHFAGKGPNDVISCLNDYVSALPETVDTLHIFCDNCFSQNKNRYLTAYLHYLSNTRFQHVKVYYPIPGHSRMPCDRDFGRIEQKKKTMDRVIKPSEWVNLIKTTDHKTPFKVKYVEHPLTDDLKDDGTTVVKVKDYKAAFEPMIKPPPHIAQTRGMTFERAKVPVGRHSMTGVANEPMPVLKRGMKATNLKTAFRRARDAYTDFLPIKSAKLKDVQSLLEHVYLPESVTFYDSLTGKADVADEVDEYE